MEIGKVHTAYHGLLHRLGLYESLVTDPKSRRLKDDDARFIGRLLVMMRQHFDSTMRVLEIGRSRGYSLGWFCMLHEVTHVASIDPNRTEFDIKVEGYCRSSYSTTTLDIHVGTSDTFQFSDVPFNFALIDGNHRYEWAKKDWENILPHMHPSGAVYFDNLKHMDGCGRAFTEIDGYTKREIDNTGQRGGLVYLGNNHDFWQQILLLDGRSDEVTRSPAQTYDLH